MEVKADIDSKDCGQSISRHSTSVRNVRMQRRRLRGWDQAQKRRQTTAPQTAAARPLYVHLRLLGETILDAISRPDVAQACATYRLPRVNPSAGKLRACGRRLGSGVVVCGAGCLESGRLDRRCRWSFGLAPRVEGERCSSSFTLLESGCDACISELCGDVCCLSKGNSNQSVSHWRYRNDWRESNSLLKPSGPALAQCTDGHIPVCNVERD